MRWKNVLSRFEELFGEAISAGRLDLADRLAGIAMGIRRAAAGPHRSLHDLFDLLDDGELAGLEEREMAPACTLGLEGLAKDYEDLLRDYFADLDDDDACSEAPIGYYPRRVRRSTLRNTAGGLMPMA